MMKLKRKQKLHMNKIYENQNNLKFCFFSKSLKPQFYFLMGEKQFLQTFCYQLENEYDYNEKPQ